MTTEGLVVEPAVAGGGNGGGGSDEGDRLKQRWGDKVYTRRSKKAKTITSTGDLGSIAAKGLELSTKDVGLHMEVQHAATNCVESTIAELPQHETPAPPAQELPIQAEKHSICIAKLVSKDKLGLLSKSKQESRDLKGKFAKDLETVRGVMRKVGIEKEASTMIDSSMVSLTPSVYAQRLQGMRPLNQLSVGIMGNSFGMTEITEKRTPKANQFYRDSEFILENDKFLPSESNKNSSALLENKNYGSALEFRVGSKTFKGCSALLERLLKHKFSRIFDSPVDVKGLGLHDYFSIIKQPMDLGTVRERLNSEYYKVPREFAEDVRLTFSNAMTYNPEGHEVHTMAKVLLKIFEEKWAAIETEYLRALKLGYNNDARTPTSARSTPLAPSLLSPVGGRFLSRSQTMVNRTSTCRIKAPKKPKAKDLNKRDMTYAEKQKLISWLQRLPIEKIDGIVQIIKRKNSSLSHQTKEIEVDIDAVDTETLWELDRFIMNQRKNLSKMKRRNELAALSGREANVVVPQNMMATEPVPVEVTQGAAVEETLAGTKTDDKFVSSSNVAPPSVVANNSKSSSSSSDTGSSSSNGSDSKSSQDGPDVRRSPAS
ncbi:unnamed protein product [Rhodiola kirilowii]